MTMAALTAGAGNANPGKLEAPLRVWRSLRQQLRTGRSGGKSAGIGEVTRRRWAQGVIARPAMEVVQQSSFVGISARQGCDTMCRSSGG